MFGTKTIAASMSWRDRRHRSRRAEVEVTPLERRALLSTASISAPTSTSPITITESVSPQTLWPPNGRFVPVTVSGTIKENDTHATLNTMVDYTVTDSETNHKTMGSTAIMVNPTTMVDSYSFSVSLQARRSGHDFNGRQYTITVTASDSDNNTGFNSAVVTVPHDQGRHNGRGKFGGGTLAPTPTMTTSFPGGSGEQGDGSDHGHGHGKGNRDNGNQDNGTGNGNGHNKHNGD
jgi:hypothetical protein